MPLITVEGRAVQHRPAERATVRVRIHAKAAGELGGLLARVDETFARLCGDARGFESGGVVTWWGNEQPLTWTTKEWEKPSAHAEGRTVVYTHAGAGLTVKFRDFAVMAGWVAAVGRLPLADVTGIAWTLTEAEQESLVERARHLAAKDAARRAATYAAALGLTSVSLRTLYEEGLRPSTVQGSKASGVGARNGGASATAGELMLRPEDVEVVSVVTADFEVG